MTTERLTPATHARITAEARERANALRRAATNAGLDAIAGGLRRAASGLAAAFRSARTLRQLEA